MTSTSNDFSKILDWPHGSPFPLQRGGSEGLRQGKILAEVNSPAEVVLGPCPASQEIDNFSRDHTHTATLSPSPNSQGDSEQPGKVRMGSSKPRACQHQSPRQTRPSEAKRTPAHTTLVDRCQTLWCSEGLHIPPFLPHRKRDLDLDSQDVMPLVDWGWHQASELLSVGASPVTLPPPLPQ